MELLTARLLGFVMILTRISAFFLVLPIFSWRDIPIRVKVAVIVLLAIFFSMIIPSSIDSNQLLTLKTGLLICDEAIYGLAFGLVVSAIYLAVRLAGRVIERQMGLAMAQILDPLIGQREQPVVSLLEMLFIISFLSANGHHLFLLIIRKSYDIFAIGSCPNIAALVEGVVKAGSIMFMAGLRLAGPILAALLILSIVLAVLARIVPEMNILFFSFPLRIGVGLLLIIIFMPFVNSFVAEFADWMSKLLPL